MTSTTHCASCKAPIKYMRTEAGHWMPVNPDSIEGAETVFRPGVHVSHFATCPNADEHRKTR